MFICLFFLHLFTALILPKLCSRVQLF
jgi:hypothetical protein